MYCFKNNYFYFPLRDKCWIWSNFTQHCSFNK